MLTAERERERERERDREREKENRYWYLDHKIRKSHIERD